MVQQLTKGGKLPFIMMADFNDAPAKVRDTMWLENMGVR